MVNKKKGKKDIKRDKIFNNFMEENYPIAYRLKELNYEIKRGK